MMHTFRKSTSRSLRTTLIVAMICLFGAGCESGSGGPGVGTGGGAALGAGTGRAIFGNSTSAMLIGGAAGGMLGNATIDRQAAWLQEQLPDARVVVAHGQMDEADL